MADVTHRCVCGHAYGHHMGGTDLSFSSAWSRSGVLGDGCDCSEFNVVAADSGICFAYRPHGDLDPPPYGVCDLLMASHGPEHLDRESGRRWAVSEDSPIGDDDV
jgi:hypothetical protein